jgi:hypothetical protein
VTRGSVMRGSRAIFSPAVRKAFGRSLPARPAAAAVASDLLGRLDTAVLPPCGRMIARLVDRVTTSGRAARTTAVRTLARARPAPAALARLEAGTRVTVIAVVAVVAAGSLASFAHGWVADPRARAGRPAALDVPASGNPGPAGSSGYAAVVGPTSPTAGYLGSARDRFASVLATAGGGEVYAVVSLPGYRTPTQLLDILSGYRLVRVFFRVPPDGPTVAAVVRDPSVDVAAAFNRAADQVARGAHGGTAAGRAADEARALRSGCACAYGAVVRAPAARLAALAGSAAVRLVDAGGAGRVGGPATRFAALLPEQQ